LPDHFVAIFGSGAVLGEFGQAAGEQTGRRPGMAARNEQADEPGRTLVASCTATTFVFREDQVITPDEKDPGKDKGKAKEKVKVKEKKKEKKQ